MNPEMQDVLDAQALIVNRRIQREQEAERARKHAEILPLCRAALDKLTRIRDIKLPAAAERVQKSWQALEVAQKNLWAHQANKPSADSYPSPGELAAYNEFTAALESETAAARAEKINAEQAQANLLRQFFAASEEFQCLQRQEAALRPRIEEPNRTGFSLSGVR
jgi:hypothetical protein